jgi:thymidylate kinase
MHVLIEGFDGTGKSTLARTLSMATGWPAVHQSPYRPESPEEFALACSRALASVVHPDMISDRWPAVTNYCYQPLGCGGDLATVISSLRDGRVDRIIHCDVDAPEYLRIEARFGDARDAEQTSRVRAQASRVLEAYRGLMDELRDRGFHVKRYRMIPGGL